MRIIKNVKITSLTNQITYNRLLRATTIILRDNVFEFNDAFTRNSIEQKLKALYNNASAFAIDDYRLVIRDFDVARPHYFEVDIQIHLKSMIHYVHPNINNVDS